MTKKRPISFVCTCLSIAIISCLLSTISVGAETINRGYGGYGLYGDLNGDGAINESDKDIILKHIAADTIPRIKSQHSDWILTGEKFNIADINRDQVIDSRDTLRILEHMNAVKTGTNPNKRIVTVYLEHGINAGEGRKFVRKPYRGNELYSVLPATLNKSGYKFQGWYTAQSGGTKVTNSSSVGLTSHVLYAHYKKNTVAVSGIKLNKSSASVKAGSKIALTATISPSNATNKNVTWTSSNTKVATVSGGTVKGVSAGTATITAKSNNGKTATCKITVTQSNESKVKQRLDKIMNGTLTYNKNTVMKKGSKFRGYRANEQCKGYAKNVFYLCFKVTPSSTQSKPNNYKLNSTKGMKLIASYGSINATRAKQLFNNARPGDFVQIRRTHKGSHSAIVYSVSSTGVTFVEANLDGKNTVYKRTYTWANLASKNAGMSVYTATNYSLK